MLQFDLPFKGFPVHPEVSEYREAKNTKTPSICLPLMSELKLRPPKIVDGMTALKPGHRSIAASVAFLPPNAYLSIVCY
jgi:hypothetical protein